MYRGLYTNLLREEKESKDRKKIKQYIEEVHSSRWA